MLLYMNEVSSSLSTNEKWQSKIYDLIGMWRIPSPNPTESDTFPEIRNPPDT